jgi:hypothetical protein
MQPGIQTIDQEIGFGKLVTLRRDSILHFVRDDRTSLMDSEYVSWRFLTSFGMTRSCGV